MFVKKIVPGSFGWDYIGSWFSLAYIKEKDEAGNILKGRHMTVKTNNSIIQDKDKLIAAVGTEEVIIVESENAILVCNKKMTRV